MSDMLCRKVQHLGDGYLHDADDDGPYEVDGMVYCGRCHRVWHHESGPRAWSVQAITRTSEPEGPETNE